MPPAGPPRFAERFLRRCLGRRPSGPYILADLREEFEARREQSPRRARWWYQWEALRLGIRVWLSSPRTPSDPTDHSDLIDFSGDRMRLEFRLALRSLSRRPLVSGTMILTIGLAIAAATTVFAVVHGVLLTPLSYRDADRLVAIWESNTVRDIPDNVVSPANFLAWESDSRLLNGIAAMVQYGSALTGEGPAEQVGVMQASASYFALVGARPLIGRLLVAADDHPDAERVALLAEGFWRRRYGGNPDVVGRTLALNGRPTTVVGVLPKEFDFAPRKAGFFSTGGRDVWVAPRFGADAREAGGRYLQVVGRLAPGSSVAGLQAELSTLAAGYRERFSDRNAGWDVTVRPLQGDLVGESRPTLILVFVAVGLVLLVAGANVADLQLTRALERQQEIAVRAALGAGRGQLMRQLMVEGVLVAGLGGIIGLVLSAWGVAGLVASAPVLPRITEVAMRPAVIGFGGLVALTCGLAFGLAPALSIGRNSLAGRLSHRREATRPGAQRARQVLVGAQVAFSFLLLIGAAMLIRSMLNRLNVDLGVSVGGIAVADLSLPGASYPEGEDRQQFFEELAAKVAAAPGVTAASLGSIVPLSSARQATSFRATDRPAPAPGEAPIADVRFVHHGFHAVLGIGLIEGRLFAESDRAGSPTGVLINETGARLLWPGESAVGKRIEMEWGELLSAEIVGVVADVHLTAPDVAVSRTTLYWEYRQAGVPSSMTLIARTSGEPGALLPVIRQVVRAQDPGIPPFNLATMEDLLAGSVAKAQFTTRAFGLFALLTLLLATVGLYGVMASATQQRTREIGIRMAMGATAPRVVGMMLRQALRVIAPALVLGGAVYLALAGMLQAMVFEVAPHDVPTILVVASLLLLTTLAACWIPARRASSINPVTAIRSD